MNWLLVIYNQCVKYISLGEKELIQLEFGSFLGAFAKKIKLLASPCSFPCSASTLISLPCTHE